jgi:ABC-type cobalt transport system substrate-binding protein
MTTIIWLMLLIPGALTLVFAFLLAESFTSARASGALAVAEPLEKPWFQTWFQPEAVMAWSAFALAILIVSFHH